MIHRAKITHPDGYRCAPEGNRVVFFPTGTVVSGKVAVWAVADHAAAAMFADDRKTKIATPTEAKTKGRIKP